MLDYLRLTSGETPYMIRFPDEVDLTAEQERAVLEDRLTAPRAGMTVEDIIGEPLDVHHLYGNRKERREKILHLMELVGLNAEHATRYAHEFSGGQRQRIGIARALAVDPAFIVCDEPVSALDVSIQAQVINMFEDLQAQLGVAYLFVAHDLLVVHHISKRIAVMASPAKLYIAQMQDLLEKPGSCRTNSPGTVEGNWRWRLLPGECSPALAEKLLEYTKMYGRAK